MVVKEIMFMRNDYVVLVVVINLVMVDDCNDEHWVVW